MNVPQAEPTQSRPGDSEPRDSIGLEIMKSIVFGGLVGLITSLIAIIASTPANKSKVMDVALTRVIGTVLIVYDIRSLKVEQPKEASDQTQEQIDHYRLLLGSRDNFALHASFAVLSSFFLVLVLLQTVELYDLPFMVSYDKVFKLAASVTASLLCIMVPTIPTAKMQKSPRHYITTLLYHIGTAIEVSGVSRFHSSIICAAIFLFQLTGSLAILHLVPKDGVNNQENKLAKVLLADSSTSRAQFGTVALNQNRVSISRINIHDVASNASVINKGLLQVMQPAQNNEVVNIDGGRDEDASMEEKKRIGNLFFLDPVPKYDVLNEQVSYVDSHTT